MKYFEQDHRLGNDKCAIDSQTQQNKQMEDYMMFNYQRGNVPACEEDVKKVNEFMTDNYMTIKDGIGFTNGCLVDQDSMMRIDSNKINRDKNQMFTRTFQAIPDLSRGEINVENESRIQQGEITFDDFQCHGKPLDVFTPLIPCLMENIQNPSHLVESWTRGGETTRDTLKQKEFLEKNGYHFDGASLQKRQC
uniref:Uncharacterized protein n=1 Tax=Pyramimonas orientalis virus TaxID=455367 RepID=A0A7L9AYV7_POV01|nr:hypothetical protein HWQ62_00314 [Pyramimonas orientalis virus]